MKKRFKQRVCTAFLFGIQIVLLQFFPLQIHADDLDSVEISLLTCSPHEEIYSLYGHTAIRLQDKLTGEDVAINYGMFSFQKPYFVLRFVFGLTDYEMGIESFEHFCRQYRFYGSQVTQQVLCLTPEEKKQIIAAINENYEPENRVYRYNYFYDNCTTRAVDMILNHLSVPNNFDKEDSDKDSFPSFRAIIHECTRNHPWATFGNDILLGVQADLPTSKREWLFLPTHAMEDFETLLVSDSAHDSHRLVSETNIVVPPGKQVPMQDFPLRPRSVFILLLVLTILITICEMRFAKIFWAYDAFLMLLCGCSGIVLFLMLFSQHPTVRYNLQLLLLNPLPLFFCWRMMQRRKKHMKDWQFAMWLVLICLFFVGNLWQNYAEGMLLLASSLLIRNVWCFLCQLNNATKHLPTDLES